MTGSPTITPTPLDFEGDGGPETCSDGVDSDGDTLVDCDDPDCNPIFPCAHMAPVASPPVLVLLVVVLGLVGVFSFMRSAEPQRRDPN